MVIVLNADYSYLNTVSWKEAVCLLLKGVAETVTDEIAKRVRTIHDEYVVTKVIRLIKYVRRLFKGHVPYSRRNILIRDEFTCQYCGAEGTTIDHVVPRDKGGKNSFINCVAACKRCNSRKNNRTLKESGLFLKRKPIRPTVNEFLQKQLEVNGITKVLSDLGLK